jgi:hypothetical protein
MAQTTALLATVANARLIVIAALSVAERKTLSSGGAE